MNNLRDLSGQRFGKLTVIEKAEKKGRETCWLCKCDCGNKTIVRRGDLRSGDTMSCGCLKKLKDKTRFYVHGMSEVRPYRIWAGMKTRCNNQNRNQHSNYGGRGITYDSKWETFEGFWEDMGPTYQSGLTIDRLDNNGDYNKENCKWSTYTEQAQNKRNNIIVEIDGEKRCAKEWARIAGINYSTFITRIKRGDTNNELLRAPGRW